MSNIQDCNLMKDDIQRNACVTTHLSFFEYNVDGPVFRYLFMKNGGGENMANHIWNKFHEKNHSVLSLWGSCDNENRGILIKVISDWDMQKIPWSEINKWEVEHPIQTWA